jgi:hypothetical protein
MNRITGDAGKPDAVVYEIGAGRSSKYIYLCLVYCTVIFKILTAQLILGSPQRPSWEALNAESGGRSRGFALHPSCITPHSSSLNPKRSQPQGIYGRLPSRT